MRKRLAYSLIFILFQTGLFGWQKQPQSDGTQPAAAGSSTNSVASLQVLEKWNGLRARRIAFTPGAIWTSRCDQVECGITRIDANNGKIVMTIATSDPPYGIAASDNAVWAAIPRENLVLRIDPATNEIVAKIPTGKSPTDVAAGEGAIWVANTDEKSVSRIDPQANAVTATIRVGTFPNAVAVSHGAVWVANAEACWGCVGSISRIDPAKNAVVKTIKTWKYGTEVSPSDVIAREDSVWVIADEHVLHIDPQSNKIVKWIRIPSRKLFSMPEGFGPVKLHGLTVIDGVLWVADTAEHALWKIDTHTDNLIHEPVSVSFPVQVLPLSDGGNGQSLWVTNLSEGSTLRIKP